MRRQPIAGTGIDAPAAPEVTPEESADGDGPRVDAPAIAPQGPSGLRRIAAIVGTPSNWRVRTKLIAILAVPIIAILVNASIGANTVLTSTRDVNRAQDMVEISRAATTLVFALEQERTYTVGYVALRSAPGSFDRLKTLQTQVDEAARKYEESAKDQQDAFTEQTRAALQSVADRLSHRANVRAAALTLVSPDSVQVAYTGMIDSLVKLAALIPQGQDDATLNADVDAVDAVIRAREQLAAQQALIHGVLQKGHFDNTDYRLFVGFGTERESQISRFEAMANPSQAGVYRATLTGQDVSETSNEVQMVLIGRIGQQLELDSSKWLQATQATMDRNGKVIASLYDDTSNRIQKLRSSIQRNALLSGLLIVLILTTALLAAMVVARSLVRPLLGLRTAALDIAGHRLPEAVRRLRDSTDQNIDPDVEPVGINTDEEIGEVARAFDEVHREAVRLASEQAVLRNNVNAMFVNLSRRSQGLVERQLRLIDDLENREQDPDQLSNLFKLDHLATRMRRNNESLLVLAGTDTARRWTHPVPLNEVVLAAISEVEQYTRVKQTAAASVSIAGNAVSDVVHLIAELLENATSFSPPATEVQVSSRSLGPGAGSIIEIEDRGIGMPAKDLERINERLASPPVIDVSVSRTMGLFAVGRLATRHGIRVQLRESASGGITAVIRLPAKVVAGDPASATPSRATAALTAGRPAASHPALDSGFPPALSNGNAVSDGIPLGNGMSRGESNGRVLVNGSTISKGNSPHPSDPRNDPETNPPLLSPNMNGSGSDPGYHAGPDDRFTGSADLGLEKLDVGGSFGDDIGSGPLEVSRITAHRPNADPSFLNESPPGGYEIPRGPGTGSHPIPDTGPTYLDLAANTGPTNMDPNSSGPANIGNTDNTGPAGAAPSVSTDRIVANGARGASAGEPASFSRQPPAPAAQFFTPAAQVGQQSGVMPPGGAHLDFGPEQASPPLDNPSFVNAVEEAAPDRDGDDNDTTPIFDSVSAWFQRHSPASPHALPTRPRTPGQSPLGRPGPAVHRGPTNLRGDSRPSESASRPGGQAAITAGGEITRPPSPFPPSPSPFPASARASQPTATTGQAGTGPPAPTPTNVTMPVWSPAPAEPLPPTTVATGVAETQSAPPAARPVSWSSAADTGWHAAEAARQPAPGGTTRAGLPLRVPMTHLVPGSAEPGPQRQSPEGHSRSPEAVGGRLASFYQGVRQGRDTTRDAAPTSRRDAQEDV
ncbi:sensor histidine kinase [Protofrankia symbiont of Coriaria ruscifolia]|uniref:sensor histidine kinase n=1 Tax=Protofrankia symbiont of Coriaria ruscifolia TaxID=1306542 RepID=UPI00104135E8|nr:nitrate- and nitrite sensing domain-containing protein [Protofrankia symbiont of Coriaria ruscifolia]